MDNSEIRIMNNCKTHILKSSASSRSLLLAFVAAFGMHGTAVTAADLPLTGNCTILDSDSLASVLSIAWDHERAIVARRDMEEPARPVGLREHSGGFKLSLFYQDPITGPSEVVVFSMDLGEGVKYRVGSVSYNVLADGTRLLSSMSNFEAATCEVN
jgi:hypothetical protein